MKLPNSMNREYSSTLSASTGRIASASVFFFMLCFASLAAFAQGTPTTNYPEVSFFGSLRYRTELDGRFFDTKAKPLHIDLLKTQIGLSAKIAPGINAVVRLQDSRNFGEEDGSFARGTLDGVAKNFNLREAYGNWDNFLTDGLTLRFGRMIFTTNNERLIGALDWNNIGRSFDGSVLSYQAAEKIRVRAFLFALGHDELTMTQAKTQVPQSLGGLDLDLPWQDKLNLYYYRDRNASLLTRGVDAGKTQLERSTLGLYLKNSVGQFDYELEAAHQLGAKKTTDSTARADISADMFTAMVGYRFGFGLSLSLGADYYTGDDSKTANSEAFDHMFITIHKFYGYMDYFPTTVLPTTGQRKAIAASTYGLFMPNLKAVYNVDEKLSLQLWAMLFNAQRDLNTAGAKDIGMEFDLNAFYKLRKGVKLEGGFSTFMPGETLKAMNALAGQGSDTSYWGYLMVSLDW